MTYQINVSPDSISLFLSLQKVEVMHRGAVVELLKLPMPLAFACKPVQLSDLGAGSLASVYVFKRIDIDPLGYDAFARNLCRFTDWLAGLCLALPFDDARACVMLVATGRPILFIDTQGFDYARYVARLG